MPLGTRILLAFARDPSTPEIGATANYTIENCLDFARKTIPDFERRLKGETVLDYGCGPGWQAVAIAAQCGAARVFGLDIVKEWFAHGRKLADEQGCSSRVSFGDRIPSDLAGRFSVVLSLCAFEHYADPARELRQMREQLMPGGVILLAFAEPWWSHSGSHIGNYSQIPFTNSPIPWVNLFFSDQSLLELRARFRDDHPKRVNDISGGLNKMTVARFERLISEAKMEVESINLFATKGLPLVTRIPVMRELFTGAASCVLRKPASER